MKIELHEAGMRIAFRVNEDQTVELVDFSAAVDAADLKPLLKPNLKTAEILFLGRWLQFPPTAKF